MAKGRRSPILFCNESNGGNDNNNRPQDHLATIPVSPNVSPSFTPVPSSKTTSCSDADRWPAWDPTFWPTTAANGTALGEAANTRNPAGAPSGLPTTTPAAATPTTTDDDDDEAHPLTRDQKIVLGTGLGVGGAALLDIITLWHMCRSGR
ncbi:uncharacterized protein BCR38DRAFT_408853 [Pseudomassariella vexata]|uniref:Uncharacterized protein n=1 Tax=Pseudomassariella vexata TaxID=1141098 RepID=A0A1Y2E0P8_9PEZI|nr:uncharacterized protein BCR38DRAFT_408853 [Pseudomassariella vexata]ORY65110.1 hypothetical protein BCR38DRAFT_408853 [Pseudomassariella vexata]